MTLRLELGLEFCISSRKLLLNLPLQSQHGSLVVFVELTKLGSELMRIITLEDFKLFALIVSCVNLNANKGFASSLAGQIRYD